MKKITSLILASIVILTAFFSLQPEPASAALKSKISTNKAFKNYLRSGQYPGGFNMSLTYQEDYEGYSIRLMQSHTTADDKTLSFKHEAYTNISINSNPTSLYTCSSSIGDGNKQNWCKETKVVQYINSGTTTTNTANLILGSSYYPFVHTLRVSFNY